MDKAVAPLISVIMPVYNAGYYLESAISSILNQTLKNFEFLIFNDGSTDNSLEIIQSFQDERIKIYHYEENRGYVEHLNSGIKLSKGKYIARMDADDISYPGRLMQQYNFLEQNINVGLVSSDIRLINKADEIYGDLFYDKNLPVEWLLLWQNPIAHPTVCVRRDLLNKTQLQYESSKMPAEDYNLWTKLIQHTKFKILDTPVLKYRILENSAYNSNRANALALSNDISRQYLENIINQPTAFDFLLLTEFSRASKQGEIHLSVNYNKMKSFYKLLLSSIKYKFEWDNNCLDAAKVDFIKRVDILLYESQYSFIRRMILLLKLDIRAFISYFITKYSSIKR